MLGCSRCLDEDCLHPSVAVVGGVPDRDSGCRELALELSDEDRRTALGLPLVLGGRSLAGEEDSLGSRRPDDHDEAVDELAKRRVRALVLLPRLEADLPHLVEDPGHLTRGVELGIEEGVRTRLDVAASEVQDAVSDLLSVFPLAVGFLSVHERLLVRSEDLR